MMTRQERLAESFRELIALYNDARMSGRIELSIWNEIDAQFRRLGAILGFSAQDVEHLLDEQASRPKVPDAMPDEVRPVEITTEFAAWTPVGRTGWEVRVTGPRTAFIRRVHDYPAWKPGSERYRTDVVEYVTGRLFGLRPHALVLASWIGEGGTQVQLPVLVARLDITFASTAYSENPSPPRGGALEIAVSYHECPIPYLSRGLLLERRVTDDRILVRNEGADIASITWKTVGDERTVLVTDEDVDRGMNMTGLWTTLGRMPVVSNPDPALAAETPILSEYLRFIGAHARLLHRRFLSQQVQDLAKSVQRLARKVGGRGKEQRASKPVDGERLLKEARTVLQKMSGTDPSVYELPSVRLNPSQYVRLLQWVVGVAEWRSRDPDAFAAVWSGLAAPYSVNDAGDITSLEPLRLMTHGTQRPDTPHVDTTSGGRALNVVLETDTRNGAPLWVARIPDRVDRATYERLRAAVKPVGGYWSSYKRGFVFHEDPTGALHELGLADELCALADMAACEPMTLADDAPAGRRHRLQTLFRELVALMAAALCSGRIDAETESAIDRALETVAALVGDDYHLRKAQELDACAALHPAPSPESDTRTVRSAAIGMRPVIDAPLDKATFMRYAMPNVIEAVAADAHRQWNDVKAEISAAERRPETWTGTQAEWVSANKGHLDALRQERDAAYRIHTATRDRSEPDPDASPDLLQTVLERSEALHAKYGGVLPDDMRQIAIRTFERKVREAGFYEHFPTPPHIVQLMLDEADIQDGYRVLEPSAGEGNIAEQIRERAPGAVLDTVELVPLLADILVLKGFNPEPKDFLQFNQHGGIRYDRIIMNPPYDRGVDIEHVYHAFGMLKNGGKLIALVSAAAIDGADELNYTFRDFVSQRGAWQLFTPSEYMGPSGKLTNGRKIGIVVALLHVTKQAGDTFGQKFETNRPPASVGDILYDAQGAQAWRITDIREMHGKEETVATNIMTGGVRVFPGLIPTGVRFVIQPDEETARRLVGGRPPGTAHNADGTIALPPRPTVPDVEMKPLRIVTSRPELMPPAPAEPLYDLGIASHVTLTPGQIEGINRALAALYGPARAFLLADGTGVGKTLQQLVVAATVIRRDRRPALIITKSPAIIDTSFADDARKLHISTPDAVNAAQRIVFTGSDASGLTLKRFTRAEELAGDLDADSIYICSYHMFGLWKGDKPEMNELREWVKTRVIPARAGYKMRRDMVRTSNASAEEKEAALRRITEEEETDPVILRQLELEDVIRAKNESVFGVIGSRFSVVICDEAHAFKNFDPDDFQDGSLQAFRGMILIGHALRRLLATATPADKVDHVRYLRGLDVYKTEAQYVRIMRRLGFVWHDPVYKKGELIERGGFYRDQRMPPEYVLNGISRLFENLTMAGTMIKRDLSMDNFTAYNTMIGGPGSPVAEQIAVGQAVQVLQLIQDRLGKIKACTASIINEKKWALEAFKIASVLDIVTRELLDGRQVIIFCSLVNDSDPGADGEGNAKPCSAVKKISTVNTLARELGSLFGPHEIGFVTGVRKSDKETLGDAAPECPDCVPLMNDGPEQWSTELGRKWSAADIEHERDTFGVDPGDWTGAAYHGLGDAVQQRRMSDIDAFQKGKKRILIATPEAGGTGISLDDTEGTAPRTVIIMTAPFSSVEAVQIMGRINRAKTRSRQRVHFLWVDVPIDKRLRDIISTKLKTLGAAVQGEVKKVSVDEADLVTSNNVQENYDAHNVDKDGGLIDHSMTGMQVIRGSELPTRSPFILTHKETLSNELDTMHKSRLRYVPIRLKSELAKGGRRLLLDWLEANKDLAEQHDIVLKTDRYEGPYLEARFHYELWQVLLNFMKPENTRRVRGERQRYSVGDRVVAVTDITEADAPVGTPGSVTRVWERRVRRLDRASGKVVVDESGEIIWNIIYDYQVEFDNGERANNVDTWEMMPLVTTGDVGGGAGMSDSGNSWLSGNARGAAIAPAQVELPIRYPEPPRHVPLADRLESMRASIRGRVGRLPKRARRR